METGSAAWISQLALESYREAPPLDRLRAKLRPFYCPLEQLLERVPPDSGVLDIGCGLGIFAMAAVASGRATHAIGLDSNSAVIASAATAIAQFQIRFPGRHLELKVTSNFAAWPTQIFDVVSVIDVMHHLPASLQRNYFAAAAAHVRPGGLLIYKDMCRKPWWRAWANRATDLAFSRQWIHYVPVRTIECWAIDEGLSLMERSDSVRWSIYGHELRVFRKALPS